MRLDSLLRDELGDGGYWRADALADSPGEGTASDGSVPVPALQEQRTGAYAPPTELRHYRGADKRSPDRILGLGEGDIEEFRQVDGGSLKELLRRRRRSTAMSGGRPQSAAATQRTRRGDVRRTLAVFMDRRESLFTSVCGSSWILFSRRVAMAAPL